MQMHTKQSNGHAKYIFILNTPLFNLPNILVFVGALSLILNLIYYSSFSYQHFLFLGGTLASFASFYFLKILIYKFQQNHNYGRIHGFSFHPLLLKIYITLGTIGAAISIVLFIQRGFSGSENLFFNLRYAKSIEHLPSYGANHLAIFSLIASIVFLLSKKIKSSAILLALSLLPSFVGVERTGLLYGMIFYLFFYIKIYGLKIRTIGILIATFFTVAIMLAFSTNKAISAAGEFFVIPYFSYGLEAFAERLTGANFKIASSDVFGVFGDIIDLIISRKISYYDLDDAGLFNVYSYVYKPYFLLGKYGFFLLMTSLGAIFFITEELSKRNIYFLFLSATLLYSVVMIFYDWTFNLSTHIYISIAATPLLFGVRNK